MNVHAGTLASARSVDETTRINELSCVKNSTRTWMGGYRKGSSFVWLSSARVQEETVLWGSGKKDSTYTNWYSREPNNSGRDENCLELFGGVHESRYLWNDVACSNKFKAVVEF